MSRHVRLLEACGLHQLADLVRVDEWFTRAAMYTRDPRNTRAAGPALLQLREAIPAESLPGA